MAMNRDKILGKILALLKEIKLREPADYELESNFTTGPDARFGTGFGVKWWFTRASLRICREIAEMVILLEPRFKDADYESFSLLIREVLEANAYSFFSLYSNVNKLFDASLLKEKRELALRLLEKIYEAFEHSIRNWLVLYPLRRVKVETIFFEFDGITLLAANDREGWTRLSSPYFGATLWDPFLGKEKESTKKGIPEFRLTETWLACEISGTALGAREKAAIKMRTFFSVLFSQLFEKSKMLPLQSKMSEAFRYSVQFSKINREYIAPIGMLLPPLVDTVEITSAINSAIKNWYIQKENSELKIAQKATAASQFISYGITSEDLEQFLHFFIALDALFGERGKVERSIADGIQRRFPQDSIWRAKLAKLFDLRSELVHGESISVDRWKGLGGYEKHFRSSPVEDITKIVMRAFQNYFNL